MNKPGAIITEDMESIPQPEFKEDYVPDTDIRETNANQQEVPLINDSNSYLKSSQIEPVELHWDSITAVATNKRNIKGKICAKESFKVNILYDVNGYAKPSTFTAIMGPSGSGKTTLLNLLSGRLFSKNIKVSGSFYMNGNEIQDINKYNEKTAYVMQDDILLATLTPRESFKFAAKIRLNIPEEERNRRVESLIKDLGLSRCANTWVGNELIRGLSGGERKRTSIGVELLTNPSLLFLDEPTTGLDSTTAFNVINLLKDIAKTGRTVISTIHQPSSQIFKIFDKLILLCEGKVIFEGDSSKAIDYFATMDLNCGEHENPGDYFTKVMNPGGLAIEMMKSSGEILQIQDQLEQDFQKRLTRLADGYKNSELNEKYKVEDKTDISSFSKVQRSSLFTQLGVLTIRNIQNTIRNPMELRMKIFQSLIFGIITIIIGFYV